MRTSTKRERDICLGKLRLSGLDALGCRKFCFFINNEGVPRLSFVMENPQRAGAAGRDRQFAFLAEILLF